MNKVDRYLLKTSCYFFALANIVALLLPGPNLFLWVNLTAVLITLLMLLLIWLTIRRYAADFGRSRAEVKVLLGTYIEDESRGKQSFHDYLQARSRPATATGEA